jgi:hypothetical protein
MLIAASSLRRALGPLVSAGLLLVAIFVPATGAGQTSATATVRIGADADARVVENRPTKNFGKYYLRVDGGSEPDEESYVRFVVPAVGTVERATLRLYDYFETKDGPAVYQAANEWSESSVTWSTRPPTSGPALADSAVIASGTWVEFDVSAAVRGAGTYTFALVPTSSDGANFNSKEMGSGPELVLQVAASESTPPPPPASSGDTQPPSTPQDLARTGATQTSVSVSWSASTDNVGVAGYSVSRDGMNAGTSTGTSYTLAGLSCGTTYTIGVSAFDAAGNRSQPALMTASTSACSTEPAPSGSVFYVSPSGSDANPGTLAAPWRTLAKAMATLTAGQTAYLRAGTYQEATNVSCSSSYNALTWSRSGTASAPITIAGYPGEEHQVVVKTKLILSGSYLRLVGLVVDKNLSYSSADGACTGEPNVNVTGDDIEIRRLEIRNSNMSGMWLRGADRVRILDNWIHDNGSHLKYDHGIYFSSGSGGVIANNVIERAKGFGIQMYPDPSGQLVTQNTVVGSYMSGIVLDTSGGGITVTNNIFALNNQYGISYRRGASCKADTNVLFANVLGTLAGSLSAGTVITADPLFVDRFTGNLRLRSGSPAVDVGLTAYSQATDHDGVARPQGAGPDIGAFER